VKNFLLLVFLLCLALSVEATHNRAGEITYRQIADLTYEFTLTTYTRDNQVDRAALKISWGDNTDSLVQRNEKFPEFGSNINRNKYICNHTFPGPSNYTISVIDPNRNADIINIPGSVDVPFYIETTLVINPFLGYNNSPILLQPPIDGGCVGYTFLHNPGAYDPDGTDSLSYRLIRCKGADGKNIPGYTFPDANKSFSLNPVTGDLVWNSPLKQGEYNVAFIIEEWRDQQIIGTIERDMQIKIGICDSAPPVLNPIPDICALAGDTIQFDVKATGAYYHDLTLTGSGSPLKAINPAAFTQPVMGKNMVKSNFSWKTQCSNISRLQQWMVFKVTDVRADRDVNLVDIKSVPIKIVGPAPKNLTLKPVGNSMVINWDKNICKQAIGYKIYKKQGKYNGVIKCPCTTGVPTATGYTLLKYIDGYSSTTFVDDDNGTGLEPGTLYCYMVTAIYNGDAESCATAQNCSVLKKDLPIITNVSVLKTDAQKGQVYIAWSKPTELDTSLFKGPFTYVITQSSGFTSNVFTVVDSTGKNMGLNDTLYTQMNLNTLDNVNVYQIKFYGFSNGKRQYIGKTQAASSEFLTIAPTDNTLNLTWKEKVPWTNNRYVIYRQNLVTGVFDSIGTSTVPKYSNTGLKNGVTFCYKIKTIGAYSASGLVNPIVNLSQEACKAPVDNTNPCPPNLNVFPDCRLHKNLLTWNNTNKSCSNDVIKYNIYYSPFLNGKMNYVTTLNAPTDTFFLNDNLESIAGCYLVTASDSGSNESLNGKPVCVDNCPFYELPNIFTPNGDNINDQFRPFPHAYIKDIDLTIYDRWGVTVFKTTDLEIRWDGKNQSTNKECVDGVYFYICDVHEIHVDGIQTRSLKGYITIIKGGAPKSGN
jgi:gliding motility-associated-like protein